MNKLDLIIDALLAANCALRKEGYLGSDLYEALAAARELRDMKPVAWYAQDDLEINDEVEVIWSSEKPTYAEVWIPLYALEQSE
jgi:hypothetical protein